MIDTASSRLARPAPCRRLDRVAMVGLAGERLAGRQRDDRRYSILNWPFAIPARRKEFAPMTGDLRPPDNPVEAQPIRV